MKRYRATGDPGEFGDWVVGVVTLESTDEAGYAAALLDLVHATTDIDAFRQLPQAPRWHARHYSLRFATDQTAQWLHERDFWPQAVQFPRLRPLIVRYIEQANSGAEGEDNWQDEFHPCASFAIAELALCDAGACSLLGSLLFKWDMGHETWQEGLIDQLFQKYGVIGPTLDLLACRMLADGQAISEQIASALHDHGFRQQMDLADFARRCALRVGDSTSPEIGLDDFALCCAAGDAAAYAAVWAQFHAAGIEIEPDDFDCNASVSQAQRRTQRQTEHWNAQYLNSTSEDFSPQSLELLDELPVQ